MIGNNQRTTSQRQGDHREVLAERSRRAAMRAEEHKRHKRLSAGTSSHNRTKSRFQLRRVNGAVVHRNGLILTWGELVGRRSRKAGAAQSGKTPPVEPDEQSAETIVLEANELGLVTSGQPGWPHFKEGLNVNREGTTPIVERGTCGANRPGGLSRNTEPSGLKSLLA